MNRFLFAVLSSALALLVAACGGSTSDSDIALSPSTSIVEQKGSGMPFETFSSAVAQSAITERRLVAVKDNDAWLRLWAEHAGSTLGARPAPLVDFTRNMVIGVFLGSRGACDRVSIAAVRQQDTPARIEVAYKEVLPPASTPCIASLANPAVLITVPQSSLPVSFTQVPTRSNDDLVVRSGWSFGFCLDNCEGSAEIANDGATLRLVRKTNPVLPEKALWGAVSAPEWETLATSINTLPEGVIGCPDCADEGREWIEVERAGQKKRVDISCGRTLAGAEHLQATVRAIRGRLAVALGLPEACSPGIGFERMAPTVFSSGIADKRFVTVRDAERWAALWNEHSGGASAPPAVDFSQKMVVGVFLGRESVNCGNMQIESIRQRASPDRLEVAYRVTPPAPNIACIAVVINQYSLVTLPATTLPVEFVKLP